MICPLSFRFRNSVFRGSERSPMQSNESGSARQQYALAPVTHEGPPRKNTDPLVCQRTSDQRSAKSQLHTLVLYSVPSVGTARSRLAEMRAFSVSVDICRP